MAKKLSVDRTLFAVTIGLVFFGLVMLYSASAVVADAAHRSSYFFLIKQSLWASIGFLVMSILMRVDYRRLQRPVLVYGFLALNVALLIAVLFSPPLKNAHRWLRLGLLSFQPSEMAKLSLVLSVAYFLDQKRERINDFFASLFLPLVVTVFLAFLVLIEPDFGTAACFLFVGFCLFFVAGAPFRYLVGLATAAAPLLYLLIVRVDYRRDRLLTFLDPFEDPLGRGFQIIQSLIAVGTGGILGAGFMRSRQKMFYLPEPHTDFIYSVIGEELGLLGALAVLGAFVVILWRGVVIARRAPDFFGSLLASGLTALIVGQALINLSVSLGLVPTTGIPLPFISAGGTSMVASLAGIGLILGISQHAR
ncbi:MAG: putative lipid II flippase FtsW [Vicinamibacteria bacterium]